MKRYLSLLLAASLLTACARLPYFGSDAATEKRGTYSVVDDEDASFWEGRYGYVINAYAPSERNVDALRKLGSDGKALGLFVIAPFKKTFTCRQAYTIQAGAPVNHSFSHLLQDAVNTELKQSGLVVSPRLRTRMKIDEFDFGTLRTKGWVIRATLKRKGRKPLTVEHLHPIPFALTASSACHNVADTLNTAIQDFLYTLYTHPRFTEFAQYTAQASQSSKNATPKTLFIRRTRDGNQDKIEGKTP